MRQIIALGGGGFSMEPENPFLDTYILKQSSVPRPNICFLPTASGDSEVYIANFYHAFKHHHCKPSHLSLFNPPTRDLADFILNKDIIYVGGGNTKNLLALWRDWGLDSILRTAWNQGIILAGISAGSLCWFEEGVTDSFGDKLEPIQCLGFLSGSNCPHYDGESERKPTFHRLILEKQLNAGFAADDGVALHFTDQKIHKVVRSRPLAKAYRVYLEDNKVIETEMQEYHSKTDER